MAAAVPAIDRSLILPVYSTIATNTTPARSANTTQEVNGQNTYMDIRANRERCQLEIVQRLGRSPGEGVTGIPGLDKWRLLRAKIG